MLVEGSSKVVQHPLADGRRQIFFRIRTRGSQNSNQNQAQRGKIEYQQVVCRTHEPGERTQPFQQRLRLEKVVKDHLQRPWFKQVSRSLPKYCKEGEA